MSYDIHRLLEQHTHPADLLYALWEELGPRPIESLSTAERVALCAWNFDSTYGNGFWDLLINEDPAMIVRELWALQQLGSPRLTEFVKAITTTFRAFGIEATSGEDLAKVESLPKAQREALESALGVTEKPFLDDIWHKGIVQDATLAYIRQNLGSFPLS